MENLNPTRTVLFSPVVKSGVCVLRSGTGMGWCHVLYLIYKCAVFLLQVEALCGEK